MDIRHVRLLQHNSSTVRMQSRDNKCAIRDWLDAQTWSQAPHAEQPAERRLLMIGR